MRKQEACIIMIVKGENDYFIMNKGEGMMLGVFIKR